MGLCELLAAWLAVLLSLLGVEQVERPLEQWQQHAGVNCYAGHGATDLEPTPGSSCGEMTLEQCEAKCDELQGCQGITVHGGDAGKVWCFRRGDINLNSCLASTPVFTTYTKTSGPVPPPPSPSSGSLGCGVAIAADWPNCGRMFDENYRFDMNAIMRNARAATGSSEPVWRYDWRSYEHPFHGDWMYIAMDWCPHGGKWEHPDPGGPSPGLLGWNEPNVPQQCNQAAGDSGAVDEFIGLAKRFKALGKFVVSPAPSEGPDWMDTFLGLCEAKHFFDVDYLAYHHYVTCDQQTSGDAMYGEMSGVLEEFIGLMNKYNGRGFKIQGMWITEIACAPAGGWAHQPYRWIPGKPELLMSKFVDLTYNYPQLRTWSWFGYGGFGQLWDSRSFALTPIGQTYFSHCHPHGAGARARGGNATRLHPGRTEVVV